MVCLLNDYLNFMDDHLREAADLTFFAYCHRNYSKVIEFVQFKERLQHSNQYLTARIESSVLQLKQRAENIEDVECILENLNYGTQLLELSNEEKLKSLTFNEDLQARPWWSPSPDVNYLSEPFEGEGSCLRENSTASSSLKGIIDANGSTRDTSSSQEFKRLLERYARYIGFSFDDAKNFILEIVKGQKSSKDFGSDVVDWVNFAIFVNAWNSRSQSSLLYGDGGVIQVHGRVLKILEDNASASNSELGERISGALQSWSSAGVLRKVVKAQNSLLSEFHRTYESKLKLLETLKQSI